MVHDHNWVNEPPLDFNRSYDERYGDEEDEASNCFWAGPDGVQHLQSMLEKDPTFETSPNWPQLVEWCSTCTARRFVRVALPPAAQTRDKEDSEVERDVKQEIQEPMQKHVDEAVVTKDATTQTSPRKKRRSGGKGSRMRRLIAFQLSLSKKHGLPPSRLVSLKGPEARPSKEESNCGQGDCAGPMLLKEEKVELVVKEEKIEMEETKEEESCQSVGASAGGSTHFSPRSTHADVILPSPQPLPCFLPFPNLYTPCFTPPKPASLCTSQPDAWILLGVVRGMQVLGHHRHLVKMLAFFLPQYCAFS